MNRHYFYAKLLWVPMKVLDVLSNWHDSKIFPLVDWWDRVFDERHFQQKLDHEVRLARIEGRSA